MRQVEVLILCAVRTEWTALRALLKNPQQSALLTDPCDEGVIDLSGHSISAALVETGMGTTAASMATLAAVERFSPKLVIYAGIAGGVKDVALGDVVIATKVYYYESGKAIGGTFRPRPEAFPTPQRLNATARSLAHVDWQSFRVHAGAVATGEKVIADVHSDQAQLLAASYGDTLALEMEGAGFMQACVRNEVPYYVVVRGISDLLNEKSASDSDGWQERASSNLARVTYEVIKQTVSEATETTVKVTPRILAQQAPPPSLERLPRPTPSEVYAVIANDHSDIAEVILKSSLPVSLVLDLDPTTDRDGLLASLRQSGPLNRPIHLTNPEGPLMSSRTSTSWISVGGLDVALEFEIWRRTTRRKIRNLLTDFSQSIGGRHLTVLVAVNGLEDERWLTSLCDDIYAEFGETVTIWGIGPKVTSMGFDESITTDALDLQHYLSQSLGVEGVASLVTIPKGERGAECVQIQRDTQAWLEEDLEILSVIPPNLDSELASLDFLRGGEAGWSALEANADVLRTAYIPWKRMLEGTLKNRRTLRMNLFHEPGAGGSTLARRAAYDTRTVHPTAMLLRFRSAETARRIDYLARVAGSAVLVVADTVMVTDSQVADLMEELHAASTPAVLVYVARRMNPLPSQSKALWLQERLDDAEANDFYDSLRALVPGRSLQLDSVRRMDDYRRNAFFFGLSAFEDDFKGLKGYVEARMQSLTGDQRRVALYCALAHYYGQTTIPEYALASLMGLPAERAGALARALDPALRQLLWRAPDGDWRTTHQLIARQVLVHIGGGENKWRTLLTTWAAEFGEFCLRRDQADVELQRLADAVFIEREGLLGSETGAKALFPRILEDIPAATGAGGLLSHLSGMVPDNAHFKAHAARYFAFKLRDFDRAGDFAKRASELDPDDHILHHVLGMVHRARVKDALGRGVSMDDIAGPVRQAAEAFGMARRLAPSNEHAYISEVQLRIDLIDHGIRRSGSISQYLAGAPHELVVESLSVAEELLARIRYMGDARSPSGYEERSRGRLSALYGDYERALQLFDSLLGRDGIDPLPVRRQIVWTHLAKAVRDWSKLNNKARKRVLTLLEENMREGGYAAADVRQWWRAIRVAPERVSQDRVHEVLTYWRNQDISTEALYCSYVAHAVDILSGLESGREDFQRFRLECGARSRGDGRRSFCLDWVGPGEGIEMLVHQSELGAWDPRGEFWSDRSKLSRLEARVSSIKGPQAGVVTCRGVEAFFVPARAGLEKGRDENVLVTGYLGFSLDGPRFWDVEIV